jgi:hypothetical protein
VPYVSETAPSRKATCTHHARQLDPAPKQSAAAFVSDALCQQHMMEAE